MPWCPKCKTEYIEGVEVCADCHTPLVASLEEGSGDPDTETLTEEIYAADEGTDPQDGPEFREADGSHPPEDEDELSEEDLSRKLREHTSTYVRPEERYSDSRSSGYMLTIIGAAGLVALVLIMTDVIHLSLDPVMQYVFYGVLGILFIVFLIMGISALNKAKEYKKRIRTETQNSLDLLEWLCDDEQKAQLDACYEGESSPEEAYFACQDLMKRLLTQKDPQIKEDYMNYIIEKAYTQLYES